MTTRLKISDLELVVALQEEGTFTQAAKRVGVSEPALSKRLQLIEDMVHARLFKRSHGGVAITDPGRSFVSGAAQIVHTFHRTVHEAREAKHGERHKLRVGVSAYLPTSLIELMHAVDLPLYHDLAIEISTGFSAEMLSELQRQEIDVALVTSPLPAAAITTHCIATNSFMIVCRESHPLAEKSSVSLAEVAEYPWAFFKRYVHPVLYDLILQRVAAENKQANIVHQGSHPDQVPALLTSDLIVAWVNPAGVECVAQHGLVCVPLIDEQIRLETHVASLASNTSQMVSEFVRKFVKLTELRRPPEQLPLPID